MLLKLNEIEKKEELTNDECLKIIQQMSKQIKDSIEQYQNGGRDDLADMEEQELKIISEFLPEPISEEEIKEIVLSVIQEIGATSMKDMGRVMGLAISKSEGKADGSIVSKIVKENPL